MMSPSSWFAADPSDSPDDRTTKVTALIVSGLSVAAGVVWTGLYVAVFGWGLIAALPLVFVLVVGGALWASHVRRDERFVVYAEIICITAIPVAISWSVGSLFESGVVVVWAFLGPMTALLFLSRPQASLWFAVFIVALGSTVALEPVLSEGGRTVPELTRSLLLAMNVGVASAVVFVFSGYFVRRAGAERARADALLLNVLPSSIATRLKESQDVIADHFESATILFADIVGSTPLFAKLSPEEAVDFLNLVFSRFDSLLESRGVEKVRTIGDAYMVVAGAPTPREDHAEAVCSLALAMVDAISSLRTPTGEELQFRFGINSGPMVGGIIGTQRFHYDLWGDTVNVAARMESQGTPGRVQVTQATRSLLPTGWELEARGPINVRGRGQMETFLLVSAPS